LAKQNTTKSLSLRRSEYVSGVADRTPAKYHLTVDGVSHLFGRERHVMREQRNYPQSGPFALEITVGDFAFAVGHRHITIFVASILKHLRWPRQSLTRHDRAIEYRQMMRSV
jgi:hypothetical protein